MWYTKLVNLKEFTKNVNMKISELINLSTLYDAYGKLLSLKQQEIMNLYLFRNFQINEIAQLKKISRQAVFNVINNCTNKLKKLEDELNFCKRLEKIKSLSQKLTLINQELQENINLQNFNNSNCQNVKIKLNNFEKVLNLLREEI